MVSCQRCKQSTNGPQAFLLTCRGCNKTWHHRCHMPPVEDDELLRRIRATNMDDRANDLSSWTCRRCKKSASATPGVTSREQTASSDDRRSVTIADPIPTTSRIASTAESHVKQEQVRPEVSVRPLTDRGQSSKCDRQESTETAPVQRTFTAKRPKSSAPKPPYPNQTSSSPPRDPDVQMTDITPTKPTIQEQTTRSPERFFSRPTPQDTGTPMCVDTVSEDDIEMRIDDMLISRTPQAPHPATRPNSIPPYARGTSLISEREREVRPAQGAAIQPQVNQDAEDDDDPDDLYGPPVERRIIRILPSLAEELREQQRRAAAEKEKKRAPLAPDWILARHAQDPKWKEVRVVGGRGRRKPTAKKLGDNGLNVNELVGYLTFRNTVREHQAK